MKIFDTLFGGKKNKKKGAQQSTSRPVQSESISFDDSFVTIPSIGLFATYSKSSSGEWVICWKDGHLDGHRNTDDGRYVLYNTRQNKVVLQGRLERPNSGKVVDNGIFSLEDWRFGNKLSGTLYVSSPGGNQLIKRNFDANVYNSAISDNGRYTVCQTANAPTGEDGFQLTAFDVEKNIELFSIRPSTGLSDGYVFREDVPEFGVVINRIGTFYYDSQGVFIDSEKFDATRLKSNDYVAILMAAREMLKSPDF